MNVSIIAAFIILVSLTAGIYPAVILSSFNPATSLKGSFAQSKKGNIIRKSLVVFQFTITIALVASIFIVNSQMNFIKNKSLGFNSNAIVEVQFEGDASVKKQYGPLRNELLANPYVFNVSEHSQNVVGGLGNGWTTTENLKGEEVSTSLYNIEVDTSYFNTYGMELAAGRFFSKNIPTDTSTAVLVNEAAVRMPEKKKKKKLVRSAIGLHWRQPGERRLLRRCRGAHGLHRECPTRACLCFVQAEAAETTARLVLSQPQSTNSKNPSSAKNAANWIKHAWRDPAISSRFSR